MTPAATAAPDHPAPPSVPGVSSDSTTALGAQARSVPAPAAAESPALGDLRWRPCNSATLQGAARCAMLTVPLDHADPSGPTIRLALSRVRHTVSERKYQGVMLVNPGGPGGSGLDFAMIGSRLPHKVAAAYDWIGFDPRGVGRSEPSLHCDKRYQGYDRPNYYPKPAANRKAWLKRSRKYAQKCARNGEILRHMTTVDAAHDMDAIRQSLGADRINFYGFSYGTYLGQVYATLYPGQVRRMVLDSNVDPRNVFYEANLQQDVAIDKVFQIWFRWLARHDDTFRLGATRAAVEQRFLGTQQALAKHPAGGKIGPSEWIDTFLPVVYSDSSWIELADTWRRYARTGRAKPLVAAYPGGRSRDDNMLAVYSAVQCTDAPWPTTWNSYGATNWRVYRKAPLSTWMNAWFNAPCLYWPVSPRSRFAVEGAGVRRGPLLVGGTRDAATPFANSLAVRGIWPGSRLVAIDGETSHAASLDGNRCVLRRVSRYLGQGELPRRKRAATSDVVCPAGPKPQP